MTGVDHVRVIHKGTANKRNQGPRKSRDDVKAVTLSGHSRDDCGADDSPDGWAGSIPLTHTLERWIPTGTAGVLGNSKGGAHMVVSLLQSFEHRMDRGRSHSEASKGENRCVVNNAVTTRLGIVRTQSAGLSALTQEIHGQPLIESCQNRPMVLAASKLLWC